MVGWQVGRQQKNQHDYDRKRLLIEEQPFLLDEGIKSTPNITWESDIPHPAISWSLPPKTEGEKCP
nr:hypothetical protein [uncultured Acetatifactor sp.]